MRYRKLPEVLKEKLPYNPDDVNIRLQHFRVYEILEMIKGKRMAYDIEDLKLISDKTLRDAIIKKGYENVKRFSWEKCAEKISEILTK